MLKKPVLLWEMDDAAKKWNNISQPQVGSFLFLIWGKWQVQDHWVIEFQTAAFSSPENHNWHLAEIKERLKQDLKFWNW